MSVENSLTSRSMMKNVWLVVALAVALVSVQCTGRTAESDAPVEQEVSEGAAEADLRDLELLKETRAVVKVNPEALFEAARDWELGDEIAPGADAREVMATLVGRMLAGDLYGESGAPGMEGLSVSEPSFAAISWGGNQRIIDDLRHGVAMGFHESKVYPWEVRVLLRSANPESLAAEIESYCEGQGGARGCATLGEVSWNRAYTIVDLELFDFGWVEEHEPSEWRRPEGVARDFIDWESPAGQAFETSQGPLALYRRAETVTELGALTGLREMSEAVSRAVPETQDRMARVGLSYAAILLMMESPESREFDDAADLFTTVEGILVAESVMSHTERGAQIFEGARRVVAVPSVEVRNPHISFEWSGDLDGGLAAAEVPGWLEAAQEEGGLPEVIDLVRASGFFGNQVPVWEYPWGAMKGLWALGMASEGLLAEVLENLHGLIGIRGALNVALRPRGPGLEFDGGIAMVFDGSVRDEDEVFEAMQSIPWGPVIGTFEMRFSVTSLGDDVVLQVGPGDHSTLFGAAREVDGFSARVRQLPLGDGLATEGQMRVRQQTSEAGSLRRVVFGDVDAGALRAVPERRGPREVTPEWSQCFREYVMMARQARTVEGRDGLLPEELRGLVNDELDRIRQGCEGATADEARWIERIGESWRSD